MAHTSRSISHRRNKSHRYPEAGFGKGSFLATARRTVRISLFSCCAACLFGAYGSVWAQETDAPAGTAEHGGSVVLPGSVEKATPVAPGTVDVVFTGPEGMQIQWKSRFEGSRRAFENESTTLPTRQQFPQEEGQHLVLTNVPGKPRLKLYAGLSFFNDPAAHDFFDHKALRVAITKDEADQAESGVEVVKVFYLPNRKGAVAANSAVQSLVFTGLEHSEEKWKEVNARGTPLATLWLGDEKVANSIGFFSPSGNRTVRNVEFIEGPAFPRPVQKVELPLSDPKGAEAPVAAVQADVVEVPGGGLELAFDARASGALPAQAIPSQNYIATKSIVIAISDDKKTLWGYSKELGKWSKVTLDEPLEGAVPSAIQDIACYSRSEAVPADQIVPGVPAAMQRRQHANIIWAFSGPAGRWDKLQLPEGREAVPQIMSDMIIVNDEGTLHIFSANTGRWASQDEILAQANAAKNAPATGGLPEWEFKIFRLRYIDAPMAERMLKELMPGTSLTTTADSRTNALLVRGSTSDLEVIEAILTNLDVPEVSASELGEIDVVQGTDDGLVPKAGDSADMMEMMSGLSPKQRAASIDQQKKAYVQHDAAAKKLALQLDGRVTGSEPADVPEKTEALREQLRQEVEAAFEARQQQQRAEVAALAQRLKSIQATIEARERIKDRIIERRIEELLNPALQWPGPESGSGSKGEPALSNRQPRAAPQVEGGQTAAWQRLGYSRRGNLVHSPGPPQPTQSPVPPTSVAPNKRVSPIPWEQAEQIAEQVRNRLQEMGLSIYIVDVSGVFQRPRVLHVAFHNADERAQIENFFVHYPLPAGMELRLEWEPARVSLDPVLRLEILWKKPRPGKEVRIEYTQATPVQQGEEALAVTHLPGFASLEEVQNAVERISYPPPRASSRQRGSSRGPSESDGELSIVAYDPELHLALLKAPGDTRLRSAELSTSTPVPGQHLKAWCLDLNDSSKGPSSSDVQVLERPGPLDVRKDLLICKEISHGPTSLTYQMNGVPLLNSQNELQGIYAGEITIAEGKVGELNAPVDWQGLFDADPVEMDAKSRPKTVNLLTAVCIPAGDVRKLIDTYLAQAIPNGTAATGARRDEEGSAEVRAINELKGQWVLEERTSGGKQPDGFVATNYYLLFGERDGHLFVETQDSQGSPLSFSVNPSKSPAEMTIFGNNMLIEGVYKVEGDWLTLAYYGRSEKDRPHAFTPDPTRQTGSPLVVDVYRRSVSAPRSRQILMPGNELEDGVSGGQLILRSAGEFGGISELRENIPFLQQQYRKGFKPLSEVTAAQNRLQMLQLEYAAQMKLLQIAVEEARAKYEAAQSDYNRVAMLSEKNTVSNEVYDTSRLALRRAELELERVKTLYDLYEKADEPGAAPSPKSTSEPSPEETSATTTGQADPSAGGPRTASAAPVESKGGLLLRSAADYGEIAELRERVPLIVQQFQSGVNSAEEVIAARQRLESLELEYVAQMKLLKIAVEEAEAELAAVELEHRNAARLAEAHVISDVELEKAQLARDQAQLELQRVRTLYELYDKAVPQPAKQSSEPAPNDSEAKGTNSTVPGASPAEVAFGMGLSELGAGDERLKGSPFHGGMAITQVVPDGPAGKAGIRTGDVLVGLHHWEIVSPEGVNYVLNKGRADELHPLKFYVVRNGDVRFGELNLRSNSLDPSNIPDAREPSSVLPPDDARPMKPQEKEADSPTNTGTESPPGDG